MPLRPSFYIFFNAKGLHVYHFPFNMDITKEREDMEEINHFSHSHPLKLVNMETILGANFDSRGGGGGEEKEKPGVIGCYACQNPISSGFAYGCTQCRHFMHKKCSQVAAVLNLPSIYEHPLTIARKAEADAIKEAGRIKIEHNGHPQHILTLQLRSASFRCDACNTKDEGFFYLCDSCDFMIHKTCASLAPTIQLPHHPNHELVLIYSLPEKVFKFAYYCEFCSIYIRRNDWLYHCANCRYFAHIKCALTAEQPCIQRDGPSTSTVDEDENGLLHFPMLDEFTDPLKLLHSEKLTQDDDDEKTEHQHWSHEHPLILHVQPQPNSMSDCSDPIEVCHGCVQPLSLPYYSCKDGCSFALHKYCAELPLKLQHPLHPDHSLVLINTWGHEKHNECNGCYSDGNTFLYRCETCKFYLDVNCAFLPRTIKHKSHKHPLIQVIDPRPLCNACDMWSEGISYACKACSFILGMHCAMRSPYSLGHRYCKGHEIPLTYPPVMDHPEDFFCDMRMKCTPNSPSIIVAIAKILFTVNALVESIIIQTFSKKAP
ncbi:uncharacterized protein LOC111890541 isoform X2 [Lactuca sativa]|uniref:uncharacterized protein LOC111890541 isoform X2 n=1 Tax=Lactuca sativa TaxID=4236 RepID=UPI000CD91DB6|nr:uncharacterized protein LOC111890541 isoform X2 [Lactuca sativa]